MSNKGKKSVLITGCSFGGESHLTALDCWSRESVHKGRLTIENFIHPGIGYALAEAFARQGLRVFATARNVSKMSGLDKKPNVTLLQLDVTSEASVASAVEAVRVETGGTLNYLVNNSGRQYWMPLLDSDLDEGKALFEVNFWGVLRMIQAFAPLLMAATNGATIANIGSIVASLYSPYCSALDPCSGMPRKGSED